MTQQEDIKLPFFRSIRGKLLLWFLGLSLIPLIAIGLIAYFQAQNALQQAAYDKLEAVKTIKAIQVETLFSETEGDIESLANTVNALRDQGFNTLEGVTQTKSQALERLFRSWQADVLDVSTNPDIVNALSQMTTIAKVSSLQEISDLDLTRTPVISGTSNPEETFILAYQNANAFFPNYTNLHDYPNALLLDTEGNIVYTVQEKNIWLSNVTEDPALNKLHNALKNAPRGSIYIADIDELNDLYIGTPVYDGTQHVGTLVHELSFDFINEIIQERTSLGVTGETFLVGLNNGVSSYRSDRVVKEGKVGQERTGNYIDAVLAGESGSEFNIGSTGDLEFSVYQPVNTPYLNWGIATTMSVEEVVAPIVEGQQEDFYTKYATLHELGDFYIVDADGYVFYSVTKEEDYHTSLTSGPYANTNLGQLVQNTLTTGKAGLSDMAPYPPHDNNPEMFITHPIINNNTLELVIAMQIPHTAINAIMNERTGMGESGETYLVGDDYRMRSDSILSPSTHSVEASFEGTVEENGVQTEPTQLGLQGESGATIANDYRGISVLSAYAPLDIEGVNWAILAEMDEAEAFLATTNLRNIMLLIVGIAIVLVSVVALWVAGSLAKPIVIVTKAAQAVAKGVLDTVVRVTTKDETGILAESFNQMTINLREQMAAEQEARSQADKLAQTEREQKEYLENTVDGYLTFVEKIATGDLTARLHVNGHEDALSTLGRNLNDMVERLSDMTTQIREATTNITAAAAEILAATSQQAAGASEQSSAISQTTTTIDEVKAIVEQAFNRAEAVAQKSQQTSAISQKGQDAVTETVGSMAQIKERVEGIAENILALSEQTQQIGEIIATVNDIASQSNLLALNASVEAARAGEHGKGFNVVAVEVRNLAEQSKQATAQVKDILNEIQRATNAAVRATEEGTKGVDEGVRKTGQTGQTIEQLTVNVGESASAARQIVASAQQQTTGMEQIALAMQNINQATMQNLASTRQAERAAQDLSALANQMSSLVHQYKLN